MVCLITGASGIAAATADLAVRRGAVVFLASVAGDEGREFFHADLTAENEVKGAVAACLARHGRVDALFNVAGISGRRFGDGPLHECSLEGWQQTMDHNAKTAFLMSREVLRHFLERGGGGVILSMSSVTAFSPEPRHFATHAYAASKGAIEAMTMGMAAYYAPQRIRVNVIAPGLVRTPMSRRAQGDAGLLEFMRAKQPLAEGMLEPDAIAKAAVFLMSDEARFITGQVFAVDGGWQVS
jgi:NAD(P)-dependent dehydrogenase (short-subunit alcohol dehydrogenase family)